MKFFLLNANLPRYIHLCMGGFSRLESERPVIRIYITVYIDNLILPIYCK